MEFYNPNNHINQHPVVLIKKFIELLMVLKFNHPVGVGK